MSRTPEQRLRLALLPALAVAAVAIAACSGTAGAGGSSAAPSAVVGSGAGGAAPASASASIGASGGIDPCQKLTTADVQPFFSVPIVTQLPGPIPDTCEWSANDAPGGVSTALDVGITTGQNALDEWSMAAGPGTHTMFSGVGEQAEHYPGIPDFSAIKGSVLCKVWTTGYAHLAGKMDYPPAAIPDDAATHIAQQYGTLCNRIYGSGDTTPTMTAAPVAASGSASPAAAAMASVPPIGGALGAGFPLPQGLDCSGKTTTDSEGTITCDATTTGDPNALYPFYLAILPQHGYTIHHERVTTATANGEPIGSILFGGNGVGDLSTVDWIGAQVTITLQAP